MDKKAKLQLFLWLEAIVWMLILTLVIGGIRYHNYKKKAELKTYQIFLQDVDGLIVGSPVRMMGLQIGHVEKVKIVADHVYVKFVLEDKNLTLPKGVIATVEFNGLGGSKSLELYEPTKESLASNKLIAVNKPMRLNEALSLLDDMFNKLGSIIVRCAHFMGEVSAFAPVKEPVSIEDEQQNLDNLDEKLELVRQNRLKFKNLIKELKKDEQSEGKNN